MSNSIPLSKADRVRQSDSQVSCCVDDEVVLMSVQNGEYYNLNPIASEIWAMLEQSPSVEQIVEYKLDQYDVQRDVCEQDVMRILNQLQSENLVEVVA